MRRDSVACMFTNTRHHSLVAWQRADDLFIKLHLLTLKQFPPLENFELGSQLRKAAYSVAANIVEGFARRSGKSRLNFSNIAEGSLAEVGYCVHVAHRLGYISDDLAGELEKRSMASARRWLVSCAPPERTWQSSSLGLSLRLFS